MKCLQTFIRYLKGTAQHFGTTRNLLREVVVSVLTALATGLTIHFLMPDQSPITDLKEIITRTLANQHEADSLRYEHRRAVDGAAKQKIIDSLQHEIIIAYERDSILLNAHLSNLDAMRQINRAIDASKK